MRARARVAFAGGLILVTALVLSSCGGRVPLAATGGRAPVAPTGARATSAPTGAGTKASSTADAGAGGSGPPPTTAAERPTATTQTAAPNQVAAAGSPTDQAILKSYEEYLTDFSILDDNLNRQSIGPLASVTTTRLAQASVRQAAALQAAHEHGAGTLRDDQVKVVMTGQGSASLVDCQDEEHFYPVADGTGTPDTFVARGYFVGSAQLVLQQGHWVVDVFTTTQNTCTY